jgi:hypothetical protein
MVNQSRISLECKYFMKSQVNKTYQPEMATLRTFFLNLCLAVSGDIASILRISIVE